MTVSLSDYYCLYYNPLTRLDNEVFLVNAYVLSLQTAQRLPSALPTRSLRLSISRMYLYF